LNPSAIYQPTDWLRPLNWSEIFGNDHPVEIDLGCGKGGFLVWAARTRPADNFLGVERQLVRQRVVDKKIQRAGLMNARLLRVEASYLVGKLIPDHSVAAYHILFPDPWPKRRHAKNRHVQPALVEQLQRTLVGRVTSRGAASRAESGETWFSANAAYSSGAVNVATDDADYFVQIRKVMAERFTEIPPEILPAEAMTEFEKIFVAAGKKISRARFEAKP
jgi:tRNA (guanine-N7-)-methyltransferase